MSDDGKSALVEFQAADRAGFRELLESRRADVRVFERGKAKKAEVEQVFRQYKKDFEWRQLGVGL